MAVVRDRLAWVSMATPIRWTVQVSQDKRLARSQAPAWECGFGSSRFPRLQAGACDIRFPSWSFTAIKLSRHSGMDRRNPDCRDANNLCHPWSLGSGDPCRNDEFFLNLMAVKLELGNQRNLLTEKFFAYLKQGKNKLEALRLARADLRHEGYAHPYFWAPFILVGEL